MAGPNNKIVDDFLSESKTLVQNMLDILNKCEGDFNQVKSLEKYSMNADRIMGAARSLGFHVGSADHPIHKVANYAEICKLVGSKASRIKDNQAFYDVCVALLLDGTEVLAQMIEGLKSGSIKVKELISQTLLERLRWVSSQFASDQGPTVDIHKGKNTKMSQGDIDDLLKKLGFD